MQTEFAQAALRYAKLGLAVVPLRPRDKKPMFDNWTNIGTCDIPLVTKWWAQNPAANVGILTGQKSHCFVLDVDPKNGGLETFENLVSKHGRFPDTWQDITGGVGGGFHLFFRYPNFEVKNHIGILPGIDIRGDGGQVVAPPSIHPDTGNRYEWDGINEIENTQLAEAPIWLLDLLHQKTEVRHSDRLPIGVKIPHGVQHMTLVSLAGMLRRLGLDAGEIKPVLQSVNKNRCEIPGEPARIDEIADSMMKYRPADSELISTSTRLWRVTKARECEAKEKEDKNSIEIIDGLTVYRTPAVEQKCVVEGLLFHGLTLLAGRPKAGKSFLSLQLALAVSHGNKFLQTFEVTRPGRVLYAALEESKTRTSTRMKQFEKSESILLQNISMIYKMLPMMHGGLEQLDKAINDNMPNLVIIDTFLKFVGDSSPKRDVLRGEYAEMDALHNIAHKYDTSIVLIHHMRKPTMGGKGLDAVAGSTGLTAAADCIWSMDRQEQGMSSIEIVGRDTEEQTLALKFNQEIGWELLGTGERVKDMKHERDICDLLREDGAMTSGKIAGALKMNTVELRRILFGMSKDGIVQQGSDRQYFLSSYAR